MDKNTGRISFKAFWDAVEQRLAAYSADELRAILRAMAQETPPSGRQAFLEKLKPSETGMGAPEPAPQEDLLADIDDWMEELRAETEDAEDYEVRHGYDWGERYDDEDSLGPYAKFVEPLDELFDRAEAVFDYGNLTLARDAYEKLFDEALKLEDEYGRGVRAQDLKVDMNQARVRYLRAVYETESPARRAQVLFNQMLAVRAWLFGPRVRLNDLLQFSPQPLPDQERFLQDWITFLRQQSGSDSDAWLREAIRLAQGTRGLEELARTEGLNRPRAFLDWLAALEAEQRPREVLAAAQYALQVLPAKLPIRAAIADFLCTAATTLNEKEILRAARWEAFMAKPLLARLLDLCDAAPNPELRTKLMQQAAGYVKEYLAQPPRPPEPVVAQSEPDGLESPVWPQKSLLAHAYLLGQRWDEAQRLAAQDQVLGWSGSDSAQGVVVPFFLALLSGPPPEALPANVAQVWQQALENYTASGRWREQEENPFLKHLARVYQELLSNASTSPGQQESFLAWCVEITKQRVNAIVSSQHRGSYDKAAVLTVACAEVLQRRGQKQRGDALLNEVRERFPRHRAFQTELKAAAQRVKLQRS